MEVSSRKLDLPFIPLFMAFIEHLLWALPQVKYYGEKDKLDQILILMENTVW